MNKKSKNIIALDGTMCAGSSAIAAYLSGNQNLFILDKYFEYNFVRERGGLFDLYLSYCDEHYNLKYGALNRFISFINYYKEFYKYYDGVMNLHGKLSEAYEKASASFIKAISLPPRKLNYILPDEQAYINRILSHCSIDVRENKGKIKKQLVSWIIKKISKYLSISFNSSWYDQYLPSDISPNEFIVKAQEYTQSVLSALTEKDNLALICTHQYFFKEAALFFDNLKFIYTTRDPRDVFYLWMLRPRDVLEAYNCASCDEEVDKFISSYRRSHNVCSIKEDKRILNIRFEDFVLRHEETTDEICNFLQISKDDIDESTYDIEYSKSRIGLWKKYPNQDVMNHIATELKEYLYE